MTLLARGRGDVLAYWPTRGERMIEVLAATSDSPRSVWINPLCTRKAPNFELALQEAKELVNQQTVYSKLHLK
jgi:hypothetical protein